MVKSGIDQTTSYNFLLIDNTIHNLNIFRLDVLETPRKHLFGLIFPFLLQLVEILLFLNIYA